MIENLGWIQIASRENVCSFIATGLEKEREIYEKEYQEAGFDYHAMYEYENFKKSCTKEEFESALLEMHVQIEEDPKELIARGKNIKQSFKNENYIPNHDNSQYPDESR